MTEAEILETLFECAQAAGLRVRIAGRAGGGPDAPPIESGVCRVRDEIWVVLSQAEPVDSQIEVLVRALRSHAESWLEECYLPPAVRARIEGRAAGSSADG